LPPGVVAPGVDDMRLKTEVMPFEPVRRECFDSKEEGVSGSWLRKGE
jgi:hypothetical protein